MLALFEFGIGLNVWPWIWLILAVVLALVELLAVPGSFLVLPWAASAFVAAFLAFGGVGVEWQWATFVFGGAIFFAILFRWARKSMDGHNNPVGVGSDRLVGARGVVTVQISPHDADRLGKVMIDGEPWGALTDAPHQIAVGTAVIVESVRGTRVVVTPAHAPGPGPLGNPGSHSPDSAR